MNDFGQVTTMNQSQYVYEYQEFPRAMYAVGEGEDTEVINAAQRDALLATGRFFLTAKERDEVRAKAQAEEAKKKAAAAEDLKDQRIRSLEDALKAAIARAEAAEARADKADKKAPAKAESK